MGLEAPTLKLVEEFVFLCQTPCVTLSVDRATPTGQRWGVPKPLVAQGAPFMPGPWLAPKTRREPRIKSRLPLIGSLRLA